MYIINKKQKRMIAIGATALFVLITILECFAIIPSGYTGVRTTFGQIDPNPVPNGFCFKAPYVQSVERVNNKQQEATYTNDIWGETSEQTVVYMSSVTVTYKINPEYSAWLYANVSDYQANAVPYTLVASAMKAAMVSLPAKDVTNRTKIEPACVEALQNAVDNKYNGENVVSIINVVVNNMDFEEEYNNAIAERQRAQVAYEQRQIENATAIEKSNAEAEQRMIEAQASAEQKRIEAQANADQKMILAEAEAQSIAVVAESQAKANKLLAASLSETLVEYHKVEKWDGKLPAVASSNATPILNAENLMK